MKIGGLPVAWPITWMLVTGGLVILNESHPKAAIRLAWAILLTAGLVAIAQHSNQPSETPPAPDNPGNGGQNGGPIRAG